MWAAPLSSHWAMVLINNALSYVCQALTIMPIVANSIVSYYASLSPYNRTLDMVIMGVTYGGVLWLVMSLLKICVWGRRSSTLTNYGHRYEKCKALLDTSNFTAFKLEEENKQWIELYDNLQSRYKDLQESNNVLQTRSNSLVAQLDAANHELIKYKSKCITASRRICTLETQLEDLQNTHAVNTRSCNSNNVFDDNLDNDNLDNDNPNWKSEYHTLYAQYGKLSDKYYLFKDQLDLWEDNAKALNLSANNLYECIKTSCGDIYYHLMDTMTRTQLLAATTESDMGDAGVKRSSNKNELAYAVLYTLCRKYWNLKNDEPVSPSEFIVRSSNKLSKAFKDYVDSHKNDVNISINFILTIYQYCIDHEHTDGSLSWDT